jgi:hypothetical protein
LDHADFATKVRKLTTGFGEKRKVAFMVAGIGAAVLGLGYYMMSSRSGRDKAALK